ncbi:DEAD/DEAH box helicase [Shewanella sp.]|uniref:DEAD/DEAH box helicase n=1 Tax=Shewanella sp. TaxID=50422 RepID=UPI001ECE0791|nr:DEAD/DEAH box helicase [Shewanella sp.]NRB24451.1 DEAD/DEAH box helicase [Shewanella sp.]
MALFLLDAYKKHKANKKRFDYEDQLFLMLKHLKDDTIFRSKIQAKNKYIIVDELQDMSKLQWRILEELIKGGSKFFGVGDPAQAIFSFRGADCEHLNTFMKRYTKGKSYPLTNNFRSTPQLLALSNFIRTKISNKYQHLVTTNSDGLKATVQECSTINSFADWCLEDIKKKLKNGTKRTDILIVARYHEQVDLIQDILKKGKVKVESDDPNNKGDLRPSLRGVKVCTIHSAKGRERNVCYVVDPRLSSNAVLDTKAEYLRLMYVAVTRAMSELVIAKSMCGQTNYKNATTDDMNILDEILYQDKLYT